METLSGAVLFQDFRNSFPEGPFSCLIATFEDFFFKLLSIIYFLALNITSRKAFPPLKPGSKAASP